MLGVANNGQTEHLFDCRRWSVQIGCHKVKHQWKPPPKLIYCHSREAEMDLLCLSIANAPTPTLFLLALSAFFLMCARVIFSLPIELARFALKMRFILIGSEVDLLIVEISMHCLVSDQAGN
jgi:hypothetical protein